MKIKVPINTMERLFCIYLYNNYLQSVFSPVTLQVTLTFYILPVYNLSRITFTFSIMLYYNGGKIRNS